MYRTIVPKSSGIYLIESISTDRKYVGSSIDLRRRKHEHFKDFSKGTHYNSFLQGHATVYGADDLRFVIIEFCSSDKLIEREQYYIDSIQPKFNLCPAASSRLGTKHTDEAIRKMTGPRPSLQGPNNPNYGGKNAWCKGLTKETDERIRRQSEKMKGHQQSEEAKRKASESLLRFYQSDEGFAMRKRMSEVATGQRHSKETKRRLSETSTGRRHTNAARKKISEAAKRRSRRPHSKETKERIREAIKISWARRRKKQQLLATGG